MGARGLRAALAALVAAGCASASVAPPPPPVLDPDLVQRGAYLFLEPALSGDGTRSCATCHPGGGTNQRSYLRGEEVEPATPGARDTPSLRGAWQTPPYLWDGSAASVREGIERELEDHMRGARPSEADLRALEQYVLSLTPFDRARLDEDGTPREPNTLRMRRGFEIFRSEKADCARCHPPPAWTYPHTFDVGTGGEFNPPTLRGLATTAPYGHDGRWATVEEAVRGILAAREVELSEREIEYLLEYLKLF